jgi:exodeoxyribonuclease V beta subunit
VVDLLLRAGATLDQILVVTFTEKATTELTHRVRRKLAELCDLRAGDRRAIEAAGADDEDCWILDEPARQRLRRAVLGFDRAHILTIHAFCQRILTENTFAQGRFFDEEPTDEREAFRAAFVETLRRDIHPTHGAATLIEAWRRAGLALERLERMLFEAHKRLACIYPTRAEALRPQAGFDDARLVEAVTTWPTVSGADQERQLLQAFKQNKVHHKTAEAWVRRLARISAALTADDGGAAALLAAVERQDREYVRGQSKSNTGLFRKLAEDLPAHAADALVARLQQAAAALDAASPPLLAALAHQLLPLIGARLARRKRDAGLFDFQDMLTLVAQSLAAQDARAGALVAALRARYRYALVDEFQDTDETQWQIFRRLFLEPGATGLLTLVGDPKQAIYSFRGADVHTYLRARAELGAAHETLFLNASYRATPDLVAAQNTLLEQDDPAPFFRVAGGIQYDHPVSCGQPGLALVDARGLVAAPVVVLDAQRGGDATATRLRLWEIKPALLDRMNAEIAALLSDSGRLFVQRAGAAPAPIGARDIFVLTRTMRESREVGEALAARRIPFAYFKQERLFETVEARAILDLLRALADPEDRSARFRAFITPFFGLTLLDLAACDDLPPDHPLAQRLDDWRALGDAGQIDQLFARILDDSGVISREVFAQGLKGQGSERALTNYLHIFELLQREAVHDPCSLRELAQRLGGYVSGSRRPADRESDVQRLETDADAVQIMTIHQSKGLEASVVFVYGATWPGPRGEVRLFHDEGGARAVRVGRQPDAEEELYLADQDDEERRVLYVALTRPRARLYLPRYPLRPTFSLKGSYQFLNDRLHALLGGITADEVRRLFQVEPIACPRATPPAAVERALTPAMAAWQPPPALLTPPPPDPAFREAVAGRAGFVVTSYSAVRKIHGRAAPAAFLAAGDSIADAEAAVEIDVDVDLGADAMDGPEIRTGGEGASAHPADELPRGRLSGSFLHEVIEHLPLDTLARAPALEDWARLPEVSELVERMRRRHDRDPAHLPHARRLVHTALSVPVRLGDSVIPSLAGSGRPTREMEFLYPIPASGHPAAAGGDGGAAAVADAPAWRIERGVVKGFIDYLFEHQGRVYVCDWKSDTLPSWDPATVAAHCERDYAIQAQVYSLAAVRLLDLRDAGAFDRCFGGVLYCFLRGMRAGDPDAGIYFHRPTWDDLRGWQRAMLDGRYWGLS